MDLLLLNGCKVKEKSEKTRHVKNNDKSKKYILRGKKILDIMIEHYLIKRNLIISILFLIQHNRILSQRSSV